MKNKHGFFNRQGGKDKRNMNQKNTQGNGADNNSRREAMDAFEEVMANAQAEVDAAEGYAEGARAAQHEAEEARDRVSEDAAQAADVNDAETEPTPQDDDAAKIAKLEEEVAKEKKEYLFLMAEFDNFRKRTLKEKSEIIKNAGENVFKGLLPIVDDFERGLKAAGDNADEGMKLIYNKLVKYLNANGVKEMDPAEKDFDADRHEAISAVPAPDESMKGKILDTVEKGYTINDKVLRHAKVVVAQ